MSNDSVIKTYQDLEVWKQSHNFVTLIYKITRTFPENEIYGIVTQIRRAAYSIPANIAEGNAKQYLKEYIQSLYYSKASLNETRYFLLLSKDLKYIKENKYNELISLLDHIEIMLMGLIKSLKRKLKSK